jgi:DNA-binding winged helix-turn-helix (wHTH) protein
MVVSIHVEAHKSAQVQIINSNNTQKSESKSKSIQALVTKNHQTSGPVLCSEFCITCPKQFDAIYFDTNVFIKRYVLSVAETTYRISKPMFRVLCAFHEHEGKVVGRKFLLAYGWGISNKVNNNVTVAISELRGLLKNITDLEIVTIHGKGYRMVNKRNRLGQ